MLWAPTFFGEKGPNKGGILTFQKGCYIPEGVSQPVKTSLNKKLDPKQKTIQTFNIDPQGCRKTKNENPAMVCLWFADWPTLVSW